VSYEVDSRKLQATSLTPGLDAFREAVALVLTTLAGHSEPMARDAAALSGMAGDVMGNRHAGRNAREARSTDEVITSSTTAMSGVLAVGALRKRRAREVRASRADRAAAQVVRERDDEPSDGLADLRTGQGATAGGSRDDSAGDGFG